MPFPFLRLGRSALSVLSVLPARAMIAAAAALLAATTPPPAARAQVQLKWSVPGQRIREITNLQDIVYTITSPLGVGTGAIAFVFKGGGGPELPGFPTGTVFFSTSRGSRGFVSLIGTGQSAQDIERSDLYMLCSPVDLFEGDTVILHAGSLQYTAGATPFPPPIPVTGTFSYTTFIANGSSVRISGDGAAAPEPGGLALLLPVLGFSGRALGRRLRRSSTAAARRRGRAG